MADKKETYNEAVLRLAKSLIPKKNQHLRGCSTLSATLDIYATMGGYCETCEYPTTEAKIHVYCEHGGRWSGTIEGDMTSILKKLIEG